MASRELKVAWAAGLFEGEGSCCITDGRQPRVQLASTDEDVVRRFVAIVGRGRVRFHERTNGNKDVWHWSVQGRDDVLYVLNLLWPFLGERRRERAYELIERASKMHDEKGFCKRGHDLSVEVNVYRHRKTGKRYCAICRRARNAAERQRRRWTSSLAAN